MKMFGNWVEGKKRKNKGKKTELTKPPRKYDEL